MGYGCTEHHSNSVRIIAIMFAFKFVSMPLFIYLIKITCVWFSVYRKD